MFRVFYCFSLSGLLAIQVLCKTGREVPALKLVYRSRDRKMVTGSVGRSYIPRCLCYVLWVLFLGSNIVASVNLGYGKILSASLKFFFRFLICIFHDYVVWLLASEESFPSFSKMVKKNSRQEAKWR